MQDKLITKGNLERVLGWINTALQAVQEGIPDIVIVELTKDTNGVYSCDKSISDIYTLFHEGKIVLLKYQPYEGSDMDVIPCIHVESGLVLFQSVTTQPFSSDLFITWAYGQYNHSTLEDGWSISGELIPTGSSSAGTLNTNNSTAQTAQSSESLAGAVNLHRVAKTGSYNDLLNKPTIPTVNNATLTIQLNGTTIGTFASNASADKTINIEVPNEQLPSMTGNAGKVLAVNSEADGLEWVSKGSGTGDPTDHDFTHTANTTISGSAATVTFAAGQRCTRMLTVSADLGLSIACNNLSDNYLWIRNSGSSEVDVTISAVTLSGTAVSNVYVPSDGITVPAGGLCEIGIIVNSDGAFITSRNDLTL